MHLYLVSLQGQVNILKHKAHSHLQMSFKYLLAPNTPVVDTRQGEKCNIQTRENYN